MASSSSSLSATKSSYDKFQQTGGQQEEKTGRRRRRRFLRKDGVVRMRLRRALRRRTRFLLAWRIALCKAIKRLRDDKGRVGELLSAKYFIFNMNLASLNCAQVK